MLNHDKTGLRIFDNFQIDFNLPKFNSKKDSGTNPPLDNDRSVTNIPADISFTRSRRTSTGSVAGGAFIMGVPATADVSGSSGHGLDAEKKPSLFDRIFNRKKIKLLKEQAEEEQLKRNFIIKEVPQEEKLPEITVEEFFKSVKNSAEELVLINERYENYEKAIAHLKASGQTALLENMSFNLDIYRAESQLFATGRTKVITEENVIEFAKKASKELKLDWVKNYTRSIPGKVIDVKIKMDELNIFDNYVVLHFDPHGTGTKLTEQDKKDKKDPILFGVIAGSQKLYYIGDWVDKYCDLTFEMMVETIGEEAISVNDITANVCPEIAVL